MPKENQVKNICQLISQYVAEQQFQPGQRVGTEAELAERFGVSKTVTRDAVHRLRGAGLLESRRRGGMYVADGHLFEVMAHRLVPVLNSSEGLGDLYTLRATLEVGAAPLIVGRVNHATLGEMAELVGQMRSVKSSAAFKQLDYQFHLMLFEHMGNRLLRDLGELITRLFMNSSLPRLPMTPLRRRDLAHNHSQIYEALVNRDSQAMIHAINRHYGGKDLKELLGQFEQFAQARSVRD